MKNVSLQSELKIYSNKPYFIIW